MNDLDEIKKVLSKIRIIELNHPDAYSKIENVINSDFVKVALPRRKFESGLKLHRCCNNYDFVEFNTIDRLSYRTDTKNITEFGRANLPNQSIFYAADVRPTAVLETSKIARGEHYKNFDKFAITTSQWESISDLNLTLIVNHNVATEKNELIKRYNIDIETLTRNIFRKDADKVFEVLHFLSDEFAINTKENNNLYKISCAFAQLAYQMSDGIVYPSIQRSFEGINFAIKPEVVLEKLKFISATYDVFVKKSEKEFIHSETKSTIGFEDNSLIWGENKIIPRTH